jgi:membrane-associated phospholipid phosphatase
LTARSADGRTAALGAGLLAAAAGLALWAHAGHVLPGERWLTARLFGHALTDTTSGTVHWVVNCGSGPVALATVAALTYFARRRGRAAFALPMSLLAPGIAALAKHALGVTPFYRSLRGSDLANMPSGHMAYATATFAVAAALAGRRDLAFLAALVPLAMAPCLVLVGAHAPNDVLAGAALGGGVAALALAATGSGARRG